MTGFNLLNFSDVSQRLRQYRQIQGVWTEIAIYLFQAIESSHMSFTNFITIITVVITATDARRHLLST